MESSGKQSRNNAVISKTPLDKRRPYGLSSTVIYFELTD